MTLSEELQWRGFLNQSTFEDITKLDQATRTFYMGFDASADSQTIGNLAAMLFARTFLRHGWQGILLAGGSTSLIGDPGGKDQERVLKAEDEVAHNVANAASEISRILQGYEFKLVNNLDWTSGMTVIPFLRDIGKFFSMTPLIQRDYIASRLGEGGNGISYTEFSYTILQGMDYLHLFDTENVTLQLGGSDQWGNCMSGVELIRRARGATVDAITLNLVINQATGRKFGKSEAGAVWLNPEKTSPTDFYQFWINVDDGGVEYYLKVYTELSPVEIDQIMEKHRSDPMYRHAQQELAKSVTELVHGKDELVTAQAVTGILTTQLPNEINQKNLRALQEQIGNARTQANGFISQALVDSGLAASISEANRLIDGNGVSINGQKISKKNFEANDFVAGRLLLKKGKKFKDSALVELIQ